MGAGAGIDVDIGVDVKVESDGEIGLSVESIAVVREGVNTGEGFNIGVMVGASVGVDVGTGVKSGREIDSTVDAIAGVIEGVNTEPGIGVTVVTGVVGGVAIGEVIRAVGVTIDSAGRVIGASLIGTIVSVAKDEEVGTEGIIISVDDGIVTGDDISTVKEGFGSIVFTSVGKVVLFIAG